jgi:hypothetical protein
MEHFRIKPQEWRHALPATLPGHLQKLRELGRRAAEITSLLEQSGMRPTSLQEHGKTLRETDEAIYAIARAEPLLAPIGLAHEADLEYLPDADLPTLASLSSRVYRNLRRRVAVLRELIGAEAS